MDVVQLHQGDSSYPSALEEHLGDLAPAVITARGNLEILTGRTQDSPLLALFCSVRCPGNLILQTYDFAQRLRQTSITDSGERVALWNGVAIPVHRAMLLSPDARE